MQSPIPWKALTALLVIAISSTAYGASPLLKQIEEEFVALSEQVRPSVVEIQVTGKKLESMPGIEEFFRNTPPPSNDGEPESNMENFFRRFLPRQNDGDDEATPEERQREFLENIPAPRSTGSGFVYTENGYIVTNNHVVDGAESIAVRFSDGRTLPAEVVGADPDTDIAVVKVESDEPLAIMELGDSDTLKIGQFAITMGSPSGLEGSFSYGHISGLGRESLGLDQELRFRGFIQTDAAINLGNSGGPLCNIDGECIGINVAIVYGANSLGFAIPINRAKEIVPQLIDGGRVLRGYLGVQIQDLRAVAERAGVTDVDNFAEALGLPDSRGAYVSLQPLDDTPADIAGLTTDDVIRSIDGQVLNDANDLVQLVSRLKPGKTIDMEVWREGEKLSLQATLSEWQGMRLARLGTPVLGMYVMPLTSDMAKHVSPDDELKNGVVVREIEEGGPAEGKIRPGDIIVKLAHKDVNDVSGFRELVKEHGRAGKVLLIKVFRRDEGEIPVGLTVPE